MAKYTKFTELEKSLSKQIISNRNKNNPEEEEICFSELPYYLNIQF